MEVIPSSYTVKQQTSKSYIMQINQSAVHLYAFLFTLACINYTQAFHKWAIVTVKTTE